MDKLDILINVSKLETVSQNFKVFVAWGKTGEGRKYGTRSFLFLLREWGYSLFRAKVTNCKKFALGVFFMGRRMKNVLKMVQSGFVKTFFVIVLTWNCAESLPGFVAAMKSNLLARV